MSERVDKLLDGLVERGIVEITTADPQREIALGDGKTVDILRDADAVAAYLDDIDDRLALLKAERQRVEQHVMAVMDQSLLPELPIRGGRLAKDPPTHSYPPSWDATILVKLWDYAPDDPELRAAYEARLNEILRPTVEYKVLSRDLWKLAKERPELEGIIADAESRKPKPRHVKVER